MNSPNAQRNKELMKSKAKKGKGSDLSTENKLSRKDGKFAQGNDSAIDDSFSLCSKGGSSVFQLRQSHSGRGEKSHASHHLTQTTNGAEVDAGFNTESRNYKVYDVDPIESENDCSVETELQECVICRHRGKLLCCSGRGCKRSFHLSCVKPLLSYVPPGIWHCIWCVEKKIKSGVHTVSKGIESILDAEIVTSNAEEIQEQRQYLVKYKGLAHIHNRWIPEGQLILENYTLVSRYQKHNRKVHWKKEWLVPHRLVDKRMILLPERIDFEFHLQDSNVLDCHHEWLVKWTSLDYDDATWELETASFFKSPEAIKLISDYEARHQKKESTSSSSKEDKGIQTSLSALKNFPFGGTARDCDHHLAHVHKLLEKWKISENALVIDDQEKVLKVVLFILSLQGEVNQPFLIITPSTAISLWEVEFSRWTSSTNVIVYKGSPDARAAIRALEFYNEGGCIMFQVLILPPNAIEEDLEILVNIKWEAIIIDECQRSSMLVHLSTIKILQANMKLLLISGQIKDKYYHSVRSFLDPKYDDISEDISHNDANLDVNELKEKLSKFVAYECKSTILNFVEYWVPVKLSNVQMEQYCASLFTNSMSLQSCSKFDSVDALHEILISTRKCCDHPSLMKGSLRETVVQGVHMAENLNAEIQLSGKLHLLHMIVLEIKKRELRVLILFQLLAGSGSVSIGDVLENIIHEKFGKDSYVRIDGGITPSRKRSASIKFNDEENGMFVCLIETRACLPSIKLSSIDSIILFNSDWNPMNDLRALHKINLTSRSEQLKIFRLYSLCTVEEKILILAKQGMTLEGNISTIKKSTCHSLLTWGASYLFHKLDRFHDLSTQASHSSMSSVETFIEDVFYELLTLLPNGRQNNNSANCSFILKVLETGGIYPSDVTLIGEVESSLIEDYSIIKNIVDNEPPNIFWINLLQGRNPRWKFLSTTLSRDERKSRRLDDFVVAGYTHKKHKNTHHKMKHLPVELDGQEKLTSIVYQNSKVTTMATGNLQIHGSSSSSEPLLSGASDQDQAPRSPSDEVPIQPLDSSGQHSMRDVRLQLSSSMTLGMTASGQNPQVQATTSPSDEVSIQPLDSVVQHSARDKPPQPLSSIPLVMTVSSPNHQAQVPLSPLGEVSIQLLDSSVQNSVRDEPLKSSSSMPLGMTVHGSNHRTQAPTSPLDEVSIQPLDSSVQHSARNVRIQLSSNMPLGMTESGPNHLAQAATAPTVEVSIQPLDSTVVHSTRDGPLQLSSDMPIYMIGNVSELSATDLGTENTSLNLGRGPEASQPTDSEAHQSVCSSLQIELERLQKDKNKNIKLHEAMKLHLKLSFKEEIDQLRKKYDQLFQSAETKFHEKKETIERSYNKVHKNKVLAEMMIQDGNAATGTLSLETANVITNSLTDERHQNIFQQIRTQNATGPKDIPENLPVPISALSCSMVQVSNQASASARIVSRQDEPSVSFMTSPQAVTSAGMVNRMSDVQQIPRTMGQELPNRPSVRPVMTAQQFVPSAGTVNYSSSCQQTYRTTLRPKMSAPSQPMTGLAPMIQALQGSTRSLASQSTDAITISQTGQTIGFQTSNGPPMISTLVMQLPRASRGLSTPITTGSNPTFPFSGNLQAGYELRTPAPHLRIRALPSSISAPNPQSTPCTGVNFLSPISPTVQMQLPTGSLSNTLGTGHMRNSGQVPHAVVSATSILALAPGEPSPFQGAQHASSSSFWKFEADNSSHVAGPPHQDEA